MRATTTLFLFALLALTFAATCPAHQAKKTAGNRTAVQAKNEKAATSKTDVSQDGSKTAPAKDGDKTAPGTTTEKKEAAKEGEKKDAKAAADNGASVKSFSAAVAMVAVIALAAL